MVACRLAVRALVDEDQPAEIAEISPLVVPGVLVQRVAVQEDDRQVRIQIALDLDVEVDPVIGRDVGRGTAQPSERFAPGRVVAPERAADRVALRGHPDRGAGRHHADGGPEHPDSLSRGTQPAHVWMISRYVRGMRGPTRLTTS
jgi:hypothetical protein